MRKPPSVRLNDTIRATVLVRLLEHSFDGEKREISRARDELTFDVYDDVYPADVRRKMRRLPEGFLATSGRLRVSMGGQAASLEVEGRPIAYEHQYRSSLVKAYPADHQFTSRHAEIYAREQKLSERVAAARSQAKAVLSACTTCGQLVEAWPEVEPFARDFMASGSPRSVALAVPVAELNRKFGLGASSLDAKPGKARKVGAP